MPLPLAGININPVEGLKQAAFLELGVVGGAGININPVEGLKPEVFRALVGGVEPE